MSDYIPFGILMEIIKRLPVKSLFQFRSISQQWKSLIDSSEFIAGYNSCKTRPQRLLVWYRDQVDKEAKYLSYVDDETFAEQDFSPPTIHVPSFANLVNTSQMVGSSKGLLCFTNGQEMVVLWNPSIRKSVGITVPNVQRGELETVIGFGVCPITSDPTIVKITMWGDMKKVASVPWVVEVFTLSWGSWRIPSGVLPDKSVKVTWEQEVIDRFIYWHGFDCMVAMDGGFSTINLIMSFDLTTKEFRVLDLPDILAHHRHMQYLSISTVKEPLAVLEYSRVNETPFCAVWIMDQGVPNSFTKLFTIKASYATICTRGFTKSGKPIVEYHDDYDEDETSVLVVYEPYSDDVYGVGLGGMEGSFFVCSYKETLLLLDRSEFSVHSSLARRRLTSY